MKKQHWEFMARMASEWLHEAYIDNGGPGGYVLPEDLWEDLLSGLKRLVLHSDLPPKSKESFLNLYVYCIQERDKVADVQFYGSREWVSIRTAVKNFLVHLTEFDFESWEQRERKKWKRWH